MSTVTGQATPATPAPATPGAEPGSALGTIVVFLIMVGIVGAGFVAQGAVAGAPALPIEVADGVTVKPPPDWEFAGRSDDGTTILLSRGNASLAVTVVDGTDARAPLAELRAEWLATGTVSATEIELVAGVRDGSSVLRFDYSGTFAELPAAIEGDVTAATGSAVVVLFDGWSGFGDYITVRDEVASIIRAAHIP